MQAQVVIGGAGRVVCAVSVHEEGVTGNVAAAVRAAGNHPKARGTAAILDIAVGDGGVAGGIINSLSIIGGRIAPHNDVGQRRVAVIIPHPAAVVGGIAAECDVRQRGAAAPLVVHPAAARGRVAAEDDVRQCGAALEVGHPATIMGGGVAAECDVRQRGAAAAVVVHPASVVGGGIAAEGDVRQCRAAMVPVVHPAARTHAACTHGTVACEGDVHQYRAAGHVAHPAAVVGGIVTAEGDVGYLWATAAIVHSTAALVGPRSSGQPGGDDEAVQYRGVVRPVANNDVVGVVAPDVVPGLGDVVAVGIGVILVNVAAEDGDISLPISLVAAVLCTLKAAVDCHAILQGEGISSGCARIIDAGLNPNFIAADSHRQSVLQCAGVCPTVAVPAIYTVWCDTEDAGGCAGCAGWCQNQYQQEKCGKKA